jgi:hypothetical protein
MNRFCLAILFLISGSHLFAQTALDLSSTYSRGNDDFNESNYETAKIKINLLVTQQSPTNVIVELVYSGVFSTDHPHNPLAGSYWLKQVFNEIEPNLTKSQLAYTPGPDGSSYLGQVSGRIFLGELNPSISKPVRGRLVLTQLPDYDPSDPRPIDSWIDWGVLFEDGAIKLGNVSMHAQWKGLTRPSEEMLRVIESNFLSSETFRDPFPQLTPTSKIKN